MELINHFFTDKKIRLSPLFIDHIAITFNLTYDPNYPDHFNSYINDALKDIRFKIIPNWLADSDWEDQNWFNTLFHQMIPDGSIGFNDKRLFKTKDHCCFTLQFHSRFFKHEDYYNNITQFEKIFNPLQAYIINNLNLQNKHLYKIFLQEKQLKHTKKCFHCDDYFNNNPFKCPNYPLELPKFYKTIIPPLEITISRIDIAQNHYGATFYKYTDWFNKNTNQVVEWKTPSGVLTGKSIGVRWNSGIYFRSYNKHYQNEKKQKGSKNNFIKNNSNRFTNDNYIRNEWEILKGSLRSFGIKHTSHLINDFKNHDKVKQIFMKCRKSKDITFLQDPLSYRLFQKKRLWDGNIHYNVHNLKSLYPRIGETVKNCFFDSNHKTKFNCEVVSINKFDDFILLSSIKSKNFDNSDPVTFSCSHNELRKYRSSRNPDDPPYWIYNKTKIWNPLKNIIGLIKNHQYDLNESDYNKIREILK